MYPLSSLLLFPNFLWSVLVCHSAYSIEYAAIYLVFREYSIK
ncbi:hypothetical protein HMPREF9144_2569 [Prevotella pallens ATCC 700821]|uniref:Uncharacterized protein n=1 Tax=Prevotella pallens ATCC 700821 TaxID=997353 RepID=F9DLM7_9BACT|nr:hypothetical protein HMPREF9144_2569 [Prevotella pallens ATCC 700821]